MNFDDPFTYMIARNDDSVSYVDGLIVRTIPATTWAIFPCVGPNPEAIQNGVRKIYQEWFPATDYEHAGLPEIEVYTAGNPQSEEYRSEMWIPILKK